MLGPLVNALDVVCFACDKFWKSGLSEHNWITVQDWACLAGSRFLTACKDQDFHFQNAYTYARYKACRIWRLLRQHVYGKQSA